MDACLTDEQLDALATSEGAQDPVDSLRTHLDQCPACRARFEECRANLTYLATVKDMLQASQAPVGNGTTADPRAGEIASQAGEPVLPSDGIPGYRILSEIHRGGQGVVYKATQLATNRTIALKVLLGGAFASLRRRDRFRREIDLVAGLNHPNIVTVYDSGLTPDGQPYLAMEYLDGVPLDQYVRSTIRGQTAGGKKILDDTLRLFSTICAAVSYAHRHGVIHRDLKPSNIRIDANGEPHIVDFGLAKVVAAEVATRAPPITMDGEFLGTVAYSAPEQVAGDAALIDTRTDVYSLGVVLYEMLTGHFPYPVVGQMADALRSITETPPEPPSSWRRRRNGRAAHEPALPFPYRIDAELDTIVLKALAKERDRRYQSAEHLGQDIEHYRAGQPIDAKRDSAIYVLRKTLSRHRLAAGLAGAAVVLIALFGIIMSVMYQNQRLERQRADAERARAVDAQGNLADAMVKLGDIAMTRHDTDDALAQYLGALAIYEHLCAAAPTNRLHREHLIRGYRRLAMAYHAAGRGAEAIETQQKAVALLPSGESASRRELERDLARLRAAPATQPTAVPWEAGTGQ
jgi:serine/threonine protein kinase